MNNLGKFSEWIETNQMDPAEQNLEPMQGMMHVRMDSTVTAQKVPDGSGLLQQ